MRRLFLALALLLGMMFVIGRATEVQAIAEPIRRGDGRYMVLAGGVGAVV